MSRDEYTQDLPLYYSGLFRGASSVDHRSIYVLRILLTFLPEEKDLLRSTP